MVDCCIADKLVLSDWRSGLELIRGVHVFVETCRSRVFPLHRFYLHRRFGLCLCRFGGGLGDSLGDRLTDRLT